MPTPLIDKWVTIEHIGIPSLVAAETIFNYQSNVINMTFSDMMTLLNAFQSRFKALIQACQSSQCQLLRTVGRTHNATAPNTDGVLDYTVNTFGTVTGDPSPNNVALCVKLMTGRSGRSFRGRQYMFGISETSTITNYAGSALAANVATLFAQYLVPLTAGSVTLSAACASRSLHSLTNYTSFSVDTRLDSQRRRLPKASDFAS